MKAKEYLRERSKHLQSLRRAAEEQLEKLEELRSLSAVASDPGRERVTGGRLPGDSWAVDRLAAIEGARLKYLTVVVALFDAELNLLQQIQALDNWKYIVILYRYYFRSETVVNIAAELSSNYTYICELKKKALAAFEEKHRELLEELPMPE